jgi:predicted PurR-regulated permease PerM
MNFYNQNVEQLVEWTQSTTGLLANIEKVAASVYTGVMSVFTVLKNVLIGIIVMIYLLNIKDTLCAQAKKIIYGLFSVRMANEIIEKVRFVHHVFGGFIIGKLVDSLIIGILTFVWLSIIKMPYTLLISVIIGVTNVIPFFGPFIGAIPSAFLLLLVSPRKCFWFLISILVIQQIDGNIIGPRILGNTTGVSSFWVLFSILFFGGLFGLLGMVIAVPTFAVIYRLISEFIEKRLIAKKLSTDTKDYGDLDHIDEEHNTYIR